MLTARFLAENYSVAELTNIQLAIMTLTSTGVLDAAIQDSMKQIMGKFTDETEEVLAREIRELRMQHKAYRGLVELGKQFIREKELKR